MGLQRLQASSPSGSYSKFQASASSPPHRGKSLESTIQTSPHSNALHIHDCRCPFLSTGNRCEKHPHNQYSPTTSSSAREPQLSRPTCRAKSWVCRIHLTPHRNLGFIVLILQMRKGSLKGRNELLQVTEPISDTVQTQSCLLMPISLCRSFPRNSGYSGGKENMTKSRRAIDAVTIRLTTDFRPRGQDAEGEAWEGKEAPFSY